MTDVPEHLLERSRQRRAALGLGGDAPAAPAASAAPAEASAAAPAATATAAAAPAPVIEAPPAAPPRPKPPKTRVPAWIMPVLVSLPVWAFFYAGAFGERASTEPLTPIQEGARIYAASCASCHGATGGGGVGPALAGGSAAETFPDEADHVEWVKNGSADVKGQPYGAKGSVATGGMPAFGGSLSEEQIEAVVLYEREGL